MKVLGMVFTYPVSLKDWVNKGIFDREKQIYEEHLKCARFDKIIWFTYGIDDETIRNKLISEGKLDKRIEIVPSFSICRIKWIRFVYSYLLPFIRKKDCELLSVIKSNQMGGARVACSIARKYNIPFALRTGYTYSIFFHNKMKDNSYRSIWKKIKILLKYYYFQKTESRLYKKCDIAMVSSNHDRKYVIESYKVCKSKVVLLSNYVDCNIFFPFHSFAERKTRFLFVGRFTVQKNLENIIMAFSGMDIGIDLFGEGEQEKKLRELAYQTKADVRFMGRISNAELAEKYNTYKYFILGSLFEGMPKSLLEAMSCGCVCFGTDVEGNREVIRNKSNGYLISGIDCDSIRNTIEEMLCDNNRKRLDQEISKKAADYVKMNHSLDYIASKEWNTLEKILNSDKNLLYKE